MAKFPERDQQLSVLSYFQKNAILLKIPTKSGNSSCPFGHAVGFLLQAELL
jgi:hypothetical protein